MKDKITMSFVCTGENAESIKAYADKWSISQSTIINIILQSFFENVERIVNEKEGK